MRTGKEMERGRAPYEAPLVRTIGTVEETTAQADDSKGTVIKKPPA